MFVYRRRPTAACLAVSDGVLEVVRAPSGGDKVLVLVSEAVAAPRRSTATAAAKELAAADAELAHWKKDLGGEYKALLARRAWAAARVDAAARLAPH